MADRLDICLVNMPYTPIERPSIALGILHAILEREGLSVQTICADLLFADRIGLRRHRLISAVRPQDPLGDWTFAAVAFPDFVSDVDAFLHRLIERDRMFDGCDVEALKDILLELRAQADAFTGGLVERILEKRPRVVGCGSTYMQHVASLALLRRVHEAAPDIITLMGGANCETIMGRTTHEQFPWVDYVVSGEADELIAPLVRCAIEHGRGVPSDALAAGVSGPAHRTMGYPTAEDGQPPRATVESLDDQPAPNYDDYFRTLEALPIRDRISAAVPIESARGCWRAQGKGCRYCSLSGCGRRFRSRPPGDVLRDIDTLGRRYGVHRFLASDNALEMRFLSTLFPDLARLGKSYRLYYQIMPNLNREQVHIVRDGGMHWLWAGIESLDDRLLRHMRKGAKAWQNIQFLKWCREAGVYVGWYIMCDFPGEDDRWYRDMADLLPLLTHLQPPWAFARVRLDRYSDYHERGPELGMDLQPVDLYRHVYPIGDVALRDLVYFFEDEARRRNPMFTALLDRPGILAASRAAARWKLAFWSENRAELSMSVTDSAIQVRDTRPIAVEPSFTLEGLERDIYLACDSGTRRQDVLNAVKRNGVNRDDIEAAVRGLVARNLMIETDGRLLALAVRAPVPDLPTREEYPGGAVIVRGEAVPRTPETDTGDGP